MRSQVFSLSLSANNCILRQSLPVLGKPYKSVLSPSPLSLSHVLLLTSESSSQTLIRNRALFRHHKLFTSIPPRKFSVRATQVNDAGSIDSPLMRSMQKKIKEQLNAESVTVKDAYGDGRHVSIDVVSASFEGQSAVNRQRMVYKAIWEELQSVVHAVDQMTTNTPAEAAARNDS